MSECYDKTPTKYQNLLSKSNEDFKPDTSSGDCYSEDSGSDYMSSNHMMCNSSEDFSDASDLNIDQYAHEDEYNLCKSSTSFTDPNEKQNLPKQVTDLSKRIKKRL